MGRGWEGHGDKEEREKETRTKNERKILMVIHEVTGREHHLGTGELQKTAFP